MEYTFEDAHRELRDEVYKYIARQISKLELVTKLTVIDIKLQLQKLRQNGTL